MARYTSRENAARHFGKKTPRTIDAWIGEGFITGYRDDDGSIVVDLDEIERAIKVNPRMKDGRTPFGPKARIVPKPIAATPADGAEL